MKQCTDCKQIKDLDSFYKSHVTPKGTQIYKPRCRECQNIKDRYRWQNMSDEQKKIYNKKNNSKKEYHKNYRLITKYNITLENFCEMYNQQEGKCFICHTSVPENEIRVDHNHTTGKTRKLLCHNCNVVLGHAKEDPGILTKCAEYLIAFLQENKVA